MFLVLCAAFGVINDDDGGGGGGGDDDNDNYDTATIQLQYNRNKRQFHRSCVTARLHVCDTTIP